jgi:ubiquinone/menaquinone biosynthesis C-methylase UbiE
MTISKKELYLDIIKKYNQVHFENVNNSWFIFMNDGYMPLDDGYPVDTNFPKLNTLHAMWRYQSYLYIQLLKEAKIDLTKNLGNILDIGCGRGGGLSVYRDYFNSDSLTGLDLNPNQIQFAQETLKGISFVQGSAMEMSFNENTFDIVTNVESANYYVYYDDFLESVNRVLKKDGLFLYADTFDPERMHWVERSLELHKFKILSKTNITKNVRAACALDKYRLLDFSQSLADIMMWDEERYYNFRRQKNDQYIAEYYIMVISKN